MTLLFHSIKSQSAERKLLHLSCHDGSIRLTRGPLDVSDTVSSVTLLSLTLSAGGCLPKMILVLCEGPQHPRRLLSTDGKWLINLFLWTRVRPFEWKRPAYACWLVLFACLRVVVCSQCCRLYDTGCCRNTNIKKNTPRVHLHPSAKGNLKQSYWWACSVSFGVIPQQLHLVAEKWPIFMCNCCRTS